MVICDHVVINKQLKKLEGASHYRAAKTFRFDQKIPVGILYLREDREWRKDLSRAIADTLVESVRGGGYLGAD